MTYKSFVKLVILVAYLNIILSAPPLPNYYTYAVDTVSFTLTTIADGLLIHFLNTRPVNQKNLLNRILALFVIVVQISTLRSYIMSVLTCFFHAELQEFVGKYPAFSLSFLPMRFTSGMGAVIVCCLSIGRLILFQTPVVFHNLNSTAGVLISGFGALAIPVIDMAYNWMTCFGVVENPVSEIILNFQAEMGLSLVFKNMETNNTFLNKEEEMEKTCHHLPILPILLICPILLEFVRILGVLIRKRKTTPAPHISPAPSPTPVFSPAPTPACCPALNPPPGPSPSPASSPAPTPAFCPAPNHLSDPNPSPAFTPTPTPASSTAPTPAFCPAPAPNPNPFLAPNLSTAPAPASTPEGITVSHSPSTVLGDSASLNVSVFMLTLPPTANNTDEFRTIPNIVHPSTSTSRSEPETHQNTLGVPAHRRRNSLRTRAILLEQNNMFNHVRNVTKEFCIRTSSLLPMTCLLCFVLTIYNLSNVYSTAFVVVAERRFVSYFAMVLIVSLDKDLFQYYMSKFE